MPKKIRIPEKFPATSKSGIPQIRSASPQGLSFSYKYFQHEHDKFSILEQSVEYTFALLARLKDLSGWSSQELMGSAGNNKTLRCHRIIWSQTTEECFNIPGEEQLVDIPYQFSLSANQHGRVHGFFIEEVFYIVWMDPKHKLYS